MTETRESLLVRSFVDLADSLVHDYDVIELLQKLVDHAVDLFDATAAGIILGTDVEHLEVVASTSEQSRLVSLMQLRTGEGPCVEAVTQGEAVSVVDEVEMAERWPLFAAAQGGSDYSSVHAIPLRLGNDTLGSLNLFRDHEGALGEADAVAVQALADVATICVLQQQALRDAEVVRAQLQSALDSRVRIEQAKGVLAHTHGLDMDDAYRLLRHHARSTSTRLADVAAGVVEGRTVIPASRSTTS